MQNSVFLKLLVLSVLSVLCSGLTYCIDGELEDDVAINILDRANAQRSRAAKGIQANGPGELCVPKGKNIMTVSWSCDLEKEAIGLNVKCPENRPPDPTGKTVVYGTVSKLYPIGNAITACIEDLYNIALYPLNVSDASAVRYDGNPKLELYVTFVRAETTQIGCSYKTFTTGEDECGTLLCVTNQPRIADGGIVYEVGNATCDSCPTDAPCNSTTGLCVPSAITTVTTTNTSPTTTMTTTTEPSTTTTTTNTMTPSTTRITTTEPSTTTNPTAMTSIYSGTTLLMPTDASWSSTVNLPAPSTTTTMAATTTTTMSYSGTTISVAGESNERFDRYKFPSREWKLYGNRIHL